MKLLVQILMVALIAGGLSAGGSFYFQQQLAKQVAAAVDARVSTEVKDAIAKQADSANSKDGEPGEAADGQSDELVMNDADLNTEQTELAKLPEPPAAIRPSWDEHGDDAGALINKLRARANATSHQERRMLERELMMNLVVNDMRFEQANSARMRKRFLEEAKQAIRVVDAIKRSTAAERAALQSATESDRAKLLEEKNEHQRITDEQIESVRREKEEAIKAAEDARKVMLQEQEDLRKQLEALRNPPPPVDESGSPEETSNLKKLVERLDAMPAEKTGEILQELVKKGGTAGAVAILNAMNARQSAKVIAAILETNLEMGADLVERLKRLKKEGESKDK